jgi:hypothetical protein
MIVEITCKEMVKNQEEVEKIKIKIKIIKRLEK